MKISFQKKAGYPTEGIMFFWSMKIETKSPAEVVDHFVPELFYDFFMVKKGNIHCVDGKQKSRFVLPRQTLRTLHTRPLTMVLSSPLVLFGARLSLEFSESFWEKVEANRFLDQDWVGKETGNLASFAKQVREYIRAHRKNKFPYPMFSKRLKESDWLVNFSPRHKRRLYAEAFGLSRKELLNIHNVQSFLEQTCDFAARSPRILHYLNPDVYYDQPHLNRSFKKMTGFSPVEYFEASSILQDNLMSASYNEDSHR